MEYLVVVKSGWLDILEKIAVIITAFTLVFAFKEYLYKKQQDKIFSVLAQVSFFRTNVLAEQDQFVAMVREKYPNYIFSTIRLDTPTIKSIRENYPEDAKKQQELMREFSEKNQTLVLNMLEELSIMIISSKTIDQEALGSIKQSFVMAVEMNAIVLLHQRELFSAVSVYNNLLFVYKKWKDVVDRVPVGEKVRKILELN